MKDYNSSEELKVKLDAEIKSLMAERRKRLNEVIHSKNITLVELGQLTGVAKSSIQRYLTGETTKIPIDFFEKVAFVTNTPIEYLTCFDKTEKVARKEIVNRINNLSDDKIDKLLGYIDGLYDK